MRRDAYGKCPVKWYIDDLGKKKWVCFAHLAPYTKHRETSEKCWYSTCPGRSMAGYPLTEEEIKEKKAKTAKEAIKVNESTIQIQEPAKICAMYGCNKKVSSTRKKYCSDVCRQRKARADYETRNPNRRKKANQRRENPTPPTKPAQPVTPEKTLKK